MVKLVGKLVEEFTANGLKSFVMHGFAHKNKFGRVLGQHQQFITVFDE